MALQLKNKAYTPASSGVSLTAYTATGNTVLNSITIHEGSAGAVVNVYLYNDADSSVTTIKQITTTADGDQILSAPLGMQVNDEIRVNVSRTGPTFVFSEALSTGSLSGVALDALSDVNAGSPATNDSLVWNGSAWVPQAVTGGGGGGSSTLSGLTDTNISGIQSGQFLQWNSVDWVNITPDTDDIPEGSTNQYWTDLRFNVALASSDLQGLGNIQAPTTGEFLKWNGSLWVTDAVASSFGDLSDVDLTGLTSGDGLEWDGTNWVPTTSAGGNHAFHQIAVSGQSTVEADSANDILELVEGTGINITTDATNDKITFTLGSHTHTHDDITDFDTEVTAIADAQIAAGSFANAVHSHTHNDITDFDTEVNALITAANLAPASHTHTSTDITNFDTAVDSRIALADSNQLHETGPITTIGDTNNGAELMEFTSTNLTLTVGDIYSLGSTGWEAATNTDASADKMLAIPVNGNDDGSEMLLKGVVKIDLVTSGAAIGDPVYLGTGNKATLTAPTSAARVIKLGRVLNTSGVIFFNPDATSIELQ